MAQKVVLKSTVVPGGVEKNVKLTKTTEDILTFIWEIDFAITHA